MLVADPDLRDLSAFRPNQRVKAGRGGGGGGALKHGASGEDAELRVPVGTQVLDDEERLLADLAHPGARAVVARGGAARPRQQALRHADAAGAAFAETGLPGEELWLDLRLKLLADAALVGFPNAGKSSLLRRISNAKPKVADYPFTTIAPVLGTVDSPEGASSPSPTSPGLIEGASEGVGLGHEFLAHLERARLLVHVVDVSEDVAERFAAINRELEQYGAGLDELPQIVVLNKIDLVPEPPRFDVDDERVLRVVRALVRDGRGHRRAQARPLRARSPAAPPPVAGRRCARRLPRLPAAPAARARVSDLSHRPRLPRRGDAVRTRPSSKQALRAAGARTGAEVEVGEETFELA